MPKISPFLWFENKQAEEAANYYTSVFPNSKITDVLRWGAVGQGLEGDVLTVEFELDGQPFTALNGEPGHPFSDAVSFVVNCSDQAEVDHYWEKLTADGGEQGPCGWLKDKFGVSWQVVPTVLTKLLADPDPARAGRAMEAMMKMTKIDIEELEAAHRG